MLKKLLTIEVLLLLVALMVARVLTVGVLFPPPPHSFGVEIGKPIDPKKIAKKLPVDNGYVLTGVPYPFPGVPVYFILLNDNKVAAVGGSGLVPTLADCKNSKEIIADHYKQTYWFPEVDTPYVSVWMFDKVQLLVTCERIESKEYAVGIVVKDLSLIKGKSVSKINSTNDF